MDGFVFFWPTSPQPFVQAQNAEHVATMLLLAQRQARLQEQAEIFVRMGYSPDELEVVTFADQVDEVLPISK